MDTIVYKRIKKSEKLNKKIIGELALFDAVEVLIMIPLLSPLLKSKLADTEIIFYLSVQYLIYRNKVT
jgi:hypothetical protein